MLAALRPEMAAAQTSSTLQASGEDSPHDSYGFWNGFFDSVNPNSQSYGNQQLSRGPADQLPDPQAQTQYLHYDTTNKHLRYASDIKKEELLDHDGDVGVSIALAQFRPGQGETNLKASQLRVDTTQVHPFVDILAPLAWSAIASVNPNKMGQVSLDQLGFRSPQAMQGTSKILLTRGMGKLAVNVSRANAESMFMKILNVMIQGAKIAAPIVSLPAISVPALSTFTEMMSYWEDRTRFIMSGNLTHAVATQQAIDDPDRDPTYMGLLSGDYLMVPQKHVDELAKALPNLDLMQGYLVAKDADPNLPLAQRAQSSVPGVTYASMHISVQPSDTNLSKPAWESSGGSSSSSSSSSKKSSSSSKSSSGSSSGSSGSGKGSTGSSGSGRSGSGSSGTGSGGTGKSSSGSGSSGSSGSGSRGSGSGGSCKSRSGSGRSGSSGTGNSGTGSSGK